LANLICLPKWVLEPTDTKKGATFCQEMNEMLNGTKGEATEGEGLWSRGSRRGTLSPLYEERLRELGLFSLEKATRGPNKCL